MGAAAANGELFWNRPAGRHIPAAVVALVLSAGLHFAAWKEQARLPFGSLGQVHEEQRFPAVRLQDVRRAAPERLERPARFRPEDPGRRSDLAAETDEWMKQLEQSLPAAPAASELPLAAEKTALAEPARPPDAAAWEPRQEILAIAQAQHAEEIPSLPRQYVADIPRAAQAPDIVTPWEGSTEAAAAAIAAARAEPGASLRAAAPAPTRAGEPVLSALSRSPDALVEETAALNEPASSVTDLQPVEQLLALEIGSWQPADEPGMGYFELRIRRQGETDLPVLPKDILLIQDCSESMTQAKLNECKDGLSRWVIQLDPQDRFDLLFFRDTTERVFGQWTAPDAVTRSTALGRIARLSARGKTDVYASLQQVLALERHAERPVVAVLVTDGRPTMGMVDSSEIIEAFTRECAGKVSMFCLGGGTRVNRFLLDLLGYKNRGDSLVVEDQRQIPSALTELARQISRPVLANLSYRFAGVKDEDIYPKTLTHLYLDRPLVLYGRVPLDTRRIVFQVVGEAGAKRYDMVFEWDWDKIQPGDAAIRTPWAWHRIYHLIGEHVRKPDPKVLQEIHDLGNRYGLIVPYGGDIPTR